MRILFLSWWWPYPANNGSKIRIYNLIKQLAAAHEVTLLSFAETDEATPEQIAHMESFCHKVEVAAKPHYNPGSVRAVLGYFSRWPRNLIDVYDPLLAARVQHLAGEADVLIASQQQMLRYLDAAPHLPAILEEVEVTGSYNRVEQAAGTSRRLRAQLTLFKVETTLRTLFQRGVAMTVVSEAERDFLRPFARADSHIAVIPNGVDTCSNQPDDTQPVPNKLIYPGAVTYSANYDAVAWFIHEVLPLVRQRIPNVQFVVTGGTGSVDVRDLAAQPGVTFTGYLPEVAPAVRSSWATVVPLREGGGTRLKILESMALGTPVISTRKGAEGLNVHPGTDILIADEPEALAEMVCTLLNDRALRERLARAGREMVEREYDWSIIGRQLVELAEKVVREKAMAHG